jgi:hypothetical protein
VSDFYDREFFWQPQGDWRQRQEERRERMRKILLAGGYDFSKPPPPSPEAASSAAPSIDDHDWHFLQTGDFCFLPDGQIISPTLAKQLGLRVRMVAALPPGFELAGYEVGDPEGDSENA